MNTKLGGINSVKTGCKIELGNLVKDKVSGISGIAVSRTEFLNGCVRYSLQPKPAKKDGSMPAELWFDEKQLEVVGKGVAIQMKRTGGPTNTKTPRGVQS
jgi:hypothetical protein